MDPPNPSNKHKRRIPQTLRRRALVSCDRCKKRRVRCLRPHPEGDCQNCLASAVKCESTLPRKHRIYGSVETLSLRYRALDALVKGLFPDESTENTITLFRIAEAHDIPMPSADDTSPSKHALSEYSPLAYPSPSAERSAHNPIVAPSSPPSNENPFVSRPTKVAEEKLIPTPHGVSHYVGSSSSFGFAFAVRNMVAELYIALPSDRAHRRLQSDFGGLRTSKALEPQVSEVNVHLDEAPEPDFEGDVVGQQQQRRRPSSGPLPYVASVGDAAPPQRQTKQVASCLPPREVADAFVEAFFQQVHSNYLLFHRGTFQLRYESIWASSINPRELEHGWICSIFMVFVFGAQALEHHDKRQSTFFQRRYLNLVQSRLHHLINTTSLVNIQALLLLQLYQHNASERNAAWMLLGCASRMAMALGMHREGATGGFDPIEKQVRRRVWWTLYMFEQNLCMMLGRPSAIDDTEVNVSLPNEALLDGGDCVPPDYIDYSLRLMKISSDIKRAIYPAPASRMQQDELPKINIVKQLLLDLESWRRSLPPHLSLDGNSLVPKQRRALLLLHIHYHHTHALLTRPYLLRKVRLELDSQLGKEQRFPSMDRDGLSLSHACGTSSRQAVVLLHQLATCGLFQGVAWLDVYYAYHGVLVLSLDFLVHSRNEEDSEDLARKAAIRNIIDVVCSTKLCTTFHILVQVAVQFARITGILPSSEEPSDGPRIAQSQPEPRAPGEIAGIFREVFEQDGPGVSWNFFDVGGYGGIQNNISYQPLIPFASTFGMTIAGQDGGDGCAIAHSVSPGDSFADWRIINDVLAPSSLSAGVNGNIATSNT